MDDRLEKYIKSHRAEMDDKNPRNDLWSDIESELNQNTKQRHISKTVIFWRAAAVILLLITSWLAFDKLNRNFSDENVGNVAVLSPQLIEAETFYISLIGQKKEEIKVMSEKYDLGGDFLNDINMLDSMYSVLKEDMNNGNEENVADAMILNLQLRIEILNQQLGIIQSIENSQKDEKIIL
jgi:hypothetical protein